MLNIISSEQIKKAVLKNPWRANLFLTYERASLGIKNYHINGMGIDYNGTKLWYKDNKLHREGGPAKICRDGSKYWLKNGQYHRDDGPAIECSSGAKYWHKNGELHREDGPAIELTDGYKEWRINGKRLKISYFP